MLSLEFYLAGTIVLYIIGMYCLATKRNMIKLLIGIVILANAANLNFIAFSALRYVGVVDSFAHALVIMAVVLEAFVTAVGFTIILNAYRHYKTLDIRELRRLRW